MFKPVIAILTIFLLASSVVAHADTMQRTVTGETAYGQYIAFEVNVNFTATGGDFSAGTGTADVEFTLENISGLYPFQSPAMGNPLMTAFMFNVTSGASVAYTEARVLAGSSIYSSGTTMNGVTIPPGCIELSSDEAYTGWYELTELESTGSYGIFTNSLETEDGSKAGFADAQVLSSCVLQGDVFSPLFIAGPVAFTIALGGLDTSLDSAEDFLSLCSITQGDDQQPSAFAGKFQATDENGEGSAFIADEGNCSQVDAEESSWGAVKSFYRE